MLKAANRALESARAYPRRHCLYHTAPGKSAHIEAIADRLGIPRDEMFMNLDRYGNTSAAAVAIALDEAHRIGTN